MHSMILGATPLRKKSQRRLFGTPITPTPTATTTAPAPTTTTPTTVTVATKTGTLIKHVKLTAHPRSDQLGVVVGITVSDTTKLDILWTEDGKTEGILPAMLSLYAVQTPSTSAAATSAVSSLKPELQRQYTSSYRSIITAKFPKDLVCPLSSIDEEEIQAYQLRLDTFVFAAHPRIRALITGDLEPPLLRFSPYLEHMKTRAAAAHAGECSPVPPVTDAARRPLLANGM